MAAQQSSPTRRSARLRLRVTPGQSAKLQLAAEISGKSLTDFILDSACLNAERMLLDQRHFTVSGRQCRALMDLLEQPAKPKKGLRNLFARKAPWVSN